ncbi:hypothetical protein ARMGADRAFT_1165973 [Armillaria gallica]|uniref:Uncharacterized protein n=1 Tax=Armillaria gallica TaxID=47427 RepID=A0A2H3DDW5_ARMGA|nr:hypothetical protein ARMGADRAFT_1165973 [Armillaria gallica]
MSTLGINYQKSNIIPKWQGFFDAYEVIIGSSPHGNVCPSLSSPDQTLVINRLADFVKEAKPNGSDLTDMQRYETPKLHLLEASVVLHPDASSEGSTPPEEKAAIPMPYPVPSYSKQPSNEAEVERVFKDVKEDARI